MNEIILPVACADCETNDGTNWLVDELGLYGCLVCESEAN